MSEQISYNMNPQNNADIVNFFLNKGREDPDYKGYELCAAELCRKLNEVTRMAAKGEDTKSMLALKPGAEDGRFKFYPGLDSPASLALIFLAQSLTDAEDLNDTRDWARGGYGQVLLGGHHNGQDIYFVESYFYDEKGDHMSWAIMNTIPPALLPNSTNPEARPFVTTGQRMENWNTELDVLADINELPAVDEPDVVKDWIHHHAEARRAV